MIKICHRELKIFINDNQKFRTTLPLLDFKKEELVNPSFDRICVIVYALMKKVYTFFEQRQCINGEIQFLQNMF